MTEPFLRSTPILTSGENGIAAGERLESCETVILSAGIGAPAD
jgi:hypothetical protein